MCGMGAFVCTANYLSGSANSKGFATKKFRVRRVKNVIVKIANQIKMNVNLLSSNLSLILCAISTAFVAYCLLRFDKRQLRKAIWSLIGLSYIAAFLLQQLVNYFVGGNTPLSLIFMIMPFTFAASVLLIVVQRKHAIRAAASLMTAATLLFSLVLVNGYYRFYPTLYSVFGVNGVRAMLADQSTVAVHFNANSTSTATNYSLEQSLDSLSKQPTAGNVYSLDIPGTASKFTPRGAYVYEPAIIKTLPNAKLPVIVLSAGFPGIPENWLGSGLQQTMDTFAAKHKGITPMIFMVDNTGSLTNDTECVNSSRGNVETYMTVDVPNYIKSHFSVSAKPANWAIGGLSMGGMCSVMLALRHPDVYSSFDDIAGEIGPEIGSRQKTIDGLFGGSASAWADHQPDSLLKSHDYSGMGGFFGVGRQDALSVTDAVHTLYNDAQKAGIQSVYEEVDGQHTFDVWQTLYKESLPWLSNRIGATECGNATCY